MKERPIIMTGESVRAILEGMKTQTRRVIKPQPPQWTWNRYKWDDHCIDVGTVQPCYVKCPYGSPGDMLWVRETWRTEELDDGLDGIRYKTDDGFKPIENTAAAADAWIEADYAGLGKWRSPIFMPRWASRITLETVSVRVEKLQDIGYMDIIKECPPYQIDFITMRSRSLEDTFRVVWDSINAKRGYPWSSNPWVWVIEFRRISNG